MNGCNLLCAGEGICRLCKSVLVQPHPFWNDLSSPDTESLLMLAGDLWTAHRDILLFHKENHEFASNLKTGLKCVLILLSAPADLSGV